MQPATIKNVAKQKGSRMVWKNPPGSFESAGHIKINAPTMLLSSQAFDFRKNPYFCISFEQKHYFYKKISAA